MPARQAGGGQVIAFLAPDSRHIEQLSHQAGAAPEGERRAGDATGEIGGIKVEIDRSGRAVIRAGPADRIWLAPAAPVFGHLRGVEILDPGGAPANQIGRAHAELQSLMRISYAVFCLKKKKTNKNTKNL